MASRESESQILQALTKKVGKTWAATRKAPPANSNSIKVPEGDYPMRVVLIAASLHPTEKYVKYTVKLAIVAPDEFRGMSGFKNYNINDYVKDGEVVVSADQYMGRFVSDVKIMAPEGSDVLKAVKKSGKWEDMDLPDLPKLLEEITKAKPVLKVFTRPGKNPQYGNDLFINELWTGPLPGEESSESPHEDGDPGEIGGAGGGEEPFVPKLGEKFCYPHDGKDPNETPVWEVVAVNDEAATCDLRRRDGRKVVLEKDVPFDDLGDQH